MDSADTAIARETVLMGHHPEDAAAAQRVVEDVRAIEHAENPPGAPLHGGATELPIQVLDHGHNAALEPQTSLVMELPDGRTIVVLPPPTVAEAGVDTTPGPAD